ncbi:MAG: hypothetical protein LBC18_01100, partial [Opitutaceae bacterium]|nr:hypothetical protein [Opitutaceae bacterium]
MKAVNAGGGINSAVESGDKSPHSKKVPPPYYGVRRVLAAFDGGIYSPAPSAAEPSSASAAPSAAETPPPPPLPRPHLPSPHPSHPSHVSHFSHISHPIPPPFPQSTNNPKP